jgi:hypothetical protein
MKYIAASELLIVLLWLMQTKPASAANPFAGICSSILVNDLDFGISSLTEQVLPYIQA